MKIFVIGRGAVGTALFAKMMQNMPAGSCGFLCDPDRKEHYQNTPFFINGKKTDLPYISPEDLDNTPADLIIFATKSGALEDAMDLAEKVAGKDTIFVSAINGIKSEEMLQKRFGKAHVIRAIAQKMDSVYSKNECSFISRGELVIGAEKEEQKQDVQTLQKVFEEYDVPFVISADIVKDQYSKLMFNCGINQVCAAYQTTYGQAASDPFLHDLFLKAMQEAKEVINKEGVDLTDQDLQDWDAALQKLQKGSMPSMAQDILAGRKTELDLFSGTILPLAKKHNIPVPVLSSLKQKIEELEAGF